MAEMMKNLINDWISQEISINKLSLQYVTDTLKNKKMTLPNDFIEFYMEANGMQSLYPNNYDRKGFLFYPIEKLITMKDEFTLNTNTELNSIILFADYMLKCWMYGLKINLDGSYEIVIVPNEKKYKVLTCSLNDFISLYTEDSEMLYNHS